MIKKKFQVRRLFVIGSILAGAIILVVACGGAVYHKELYRLYHVLTLFEPDRIVHNFQNMDRIFMTREIRASETPSRFETVPKALPKSFTYKGRTFATHDFLNHTWTTGLMVIKNDQVLFEAYYLGLTPSTRAMSWSMSKSIVSAMVGIALEEGHIKDLAVPVDRMVPELKGSGYEGVSLKDVLQMSSGIKFNEDYADFHSDINRMGRTFALSTPMDDFVASLEPELTPGTFNRYVSMDTQVLGMVLDRTTGTTLCQYLEEKIWKPAGMESDAYWLIDSHSMEMAFGALNVTMRDYARFGLLYLNRGRYEGRQIVPEQWVADSVTPDAPHLQPGENPMSDTLMGYGYQWWIPENPIGDFMAIGVYNQYIYIHPPTRTVVVKLSAYPDYNIDGEEMSFRSVALFRAIAQTM